MASQSKILQVAIASSNKPYFDYLENAAVTLSAEQLLGYRVLVPFGAKQCIGIVVAVTERSVVPQHKLRRILAVLDSMPAVPEKLLEAIIWVSQYYHTYISQVLRLALPHRLRHKVDSLLLKLPQPPTLDGQQTGLAALAAEDLPVLNTAQEQCVTTISAAWGCFTSFLLHGVTGSGKTEVYLRLMHNVLQQKQQVLVLIPEIGLTPQTVARFRARFPAHAIGVVHSRLSIRQRGYLWWQAALGQLAVVLGTRSAVFMPFVALGLIIVDEEHDASFKHQNSAPRYSARDVAVKRAQLSACPIVLGSATPSLESVLNVERHKYVYQALPMRATGVALPQVALVDVRHKRLQHGLAPALLHEVAQSLVAGQQVLFFLNRRGFARVLFCGQCHWISHCAHCSVKLVLHMQPAVQLRCHHCGQRSKLPQQCPQCCNGDLRPLGLGTEQLAAVLQERFPAARILRLDADTMGDATVLEQALLQIQTHQVDLIVGTQMIAKGHHFPHLHLVALVDVDAGLFSVDFRASERLGQLLLQVIGRAGREQLAGRVLLQTQHPEHTVLQAMLHQDYWRLAHLLLQERQLAGLPPYSFQALVRGRASKLAHADSSLTELATELRILVRRLGLPVEILGPVPAPIYKVAKKFYVQLLLQSTQRVSLQQVLGAGRQLFEQIMGRYPVQLFLDVDPIELF
jgi:primosomal protein N' (replication factor Y)